MGEGAEHRTASVSTGRLRLVRASELARDEIACAYFAHEVDRLSESAWRTILEERARLGRALQPDEVLAIVEADGGDNANL